MALPVYGTVRAPELPPDLDWLNTAHPLTLHGLRGKFVLLDFWTFCCINCLHILPDLKRLEEKYAEELVVIGVHAAKFSNERTTESIRQAILRYGVAHPVVNDNAFTLWQQYAANAWPTLFLIDPKGYILGKQSGEGIFEPIDAVLRASIPQYEAEGTLSRSRWRGLLEAATEPHRPLAFPGKMAADPVDERLFIADTNHHRVLVTDRTGNLHLCIGTGKPGHADGSTQDATFCQPQGVCYDADAEVVFVADTENHAIRRVDLRHQTVSTLAGNGKQALPDVAYVAGPAGALNSPWDILLHDEYLYVAMAGAHQIWRFDPLTGEGLPYAGTARENLIDGPRLQAHLAQPSGLATDGLYLYFLDSESSALRRVPFGSPLVAVETLVGEGLFVFGDAEGPKKTARLQHPLGLTYHDGALFIADTYNHKIKRFDLATGKLETWLGTGQAGHVDGDAHYAQCYEPSGLAVLGNQLYIADTNNHALRTADLKTGAIRTLAVA